MSIFRQLLWLLRAVLISLLGATLGWADEPAKTAESPVPGAAELPKVEVSVTLTDSQARRDFVAGKIVIGRKAIEASGAQNVQDLLKREPSLTIAPNGRVGLMGLPGYTQVLVDGVPPSPGKSPMELDLVHVERIEIVKSSLAELGPFGIAGTINVVTRKLTSKTTSQLRLGASGSEAGNSKNASWSTNRTQPDSPLRFNLQVSASRSDKDELTEVLHTRQLFGLPVGELGHGDIHTHDRTSAFTVGAALERKLDADNRLEIKSFFGGIRGPSQGTKRDFGAVDPGDVLQSRTASEQRYYSMGLPLTWTLKPDEHSSWILRFSPTRTWSQREARVNNDYVAQPDAQWQSSERSSSSINFLKLDYATDLGEVHNLKAGVTLGHVQGNKDFAQSVNAAPDPSLQAFGTRRDELDRKLSLFAQDDWRLSQHWAINLGLNSEQRRIDLNDGGYASQLQYTLWAPSAHLAWKLEGQDKRQVRLGLAKTFKAPFLDQLTLRPTINPWAACPATGLCGANSAEYADTTGNPNLKPERAVGVNLSYEQYIGEESLFSLEFFSREIADLIATDIQRQNVSWASVPRYVARPANMGAAWTRGLTLEGRLTLQEFWKNAPQVDLSGGITFAQSQVSTVPAPDNHLEDQNAWSLKLGGHYKLKDVPLELDADAYWAPSGWVRSSAQRRLFNEHRFSLGLQAAWKLRPDLLVRLSADGLLAPRPMSMEEFGSSNDAVRRQELKSAYVKLGVRVEMKL